jgi:hypothetical protein
MRLVMALAAVAATFTPSLSTGAETSRAREQPADLVFTGGVVITLDPARPRATAVAVRDGRIVAVGGDAEVSGLAGPKTRRVALDGRAIVPGLTDAHVHVEGIGEALETLDLVGAATLDEALARVRDAARGLPPGEWLLGRGWDQNDWPEKRFPTAADLDRVSGGHPVCLTRVDGHASWVNSKALAAAALGAQTPDPPGGRILRDEAGAPSGILVDAAEALVADRIPATSRAARKRRLAKGLRACAEAGLTSVHDAGVDLATVELYEELLAEDALTVRVYVMLRDRAFLDAGPSLRPRIGLGAGRLTVRAIKVVADGALGSRGALLLEPYSDEPGTRGLATVAPEHLARVVERALVQGFQVNTHAIGDAANRLVLDTYERAFGPAGGAARRFRIEHAQVVAPDDVARFKALGVVPSMQPTHCTSDMYWATDRLGPQRARGAYLWKTFLKQGVPIAAGSDAPVEDIAVVPGLYAAVSRQDAKGWPVGGWHPEERVTVEEALEMFSRHAAFAAFEEKERGAIAASRRGDLTVLSRDPAAPPAAELLRTRVVMTVVGGRVAYEAAPGAPSR